MNYANPTESHRELSASYCPEIWPKSSTVYSPPHVDARQMATRIIRQAERSNIHPFDAWTDFQAFESDQSYALDVQAHIYRIWSRKNSFLSYRRKGGLRFLTIGRLALTWSVRRK